MERWDIFLFRIIKVNIYGEPVWSSKISLNNIQGSLHSGLFTIEGYVLRTKYVTPNKFSGNYVILEKVGNPETFAFIVIGKLCENK